MAIAGFNSTYYVQQYPDVLLAISQGVFKTAEEHFTKFGAKEGRNPNAFFDSKYYLAQNQDVLQAVAAGTFASAYDHYVKNGAAEGRVPSAALATFDGAKYLAANADVKAAGFTDKTAVSHYVLYGAAEGRSGTSSSTGQTFTLTTAQDTPVGSDAADIFRGVAGVGVGQQDQTTLNSSDIIDGGKGEDTLVVLLNGNYGGGATIKNVETLQLGTNAAAAAFDYNVNAGSYEVTGVKTIVLDQINTGETLTVNNLVRDNGTGALPALSWINDNTGVNGLAGTSNVNYRAGSVSGTADEQAVNLTNVRGGALNIAAGVEKITLNSLGTATNSIAAIDSITAGTTTLREVVINATAQLGGNRKISTDAATRGLEIAQAPTNANTETTSFVTVGSGVTKVDASASTAGVNIAFTDATAVNNTFLGGKGGDTVILNGGNDSLSGGEGNDTFIFNQTNTSSNGLFFNNSDTIDGGTGTDTIQIDYAGANALNQVTIQTSEWLNSKGLDALDIRAQNSRVQLDDAFVSRADAVANSFEVITNKIVQNDTTASVADEANSRHLIDLTTVSAARAIKVTGGEGRETVIVTDALNGNSTLSGGRGLDTLVVQNSATLTGQDLQNVSGFNVFNLVKTSANAQTFNIDLTAAFLTAAIDADVAAGVSKNTANAFRILTDAGYSATTAGNGLQALSGVQSVAAGDTINITVDTTGLTTVDAINVRDLVASGATINIRNTAGTVLLAAANGAVTTNTGIFAGVTGTANAQFDDLTTNPVVGAGTPQASGSASSGGGSGSSGETFALSTGTDVRVAATAGTNDTWNGTTATLNANDIIVGNGGTDTLNLTLQAGTTGAATVADIDVINVTGVGPTTLDTTNFSSVGQINALGAQSITAVNVLAATATGTLFNAGAGYTGTYTVTQAVAAQATRFQVSGTATGANLSTNSTGGTSVAVVGTNVLNNITTGAGALTITGSGNLTVGTFTGATTVSAAAATGTLTVTDIGATVITGSAQADTFTQATAVNASVNGGAGNDTFTFGTTGTLTDADSVNGGAGTDTVNAVAATLTVANQLVSIENLVLTGGSSNIATADNTVDNDAVLTVTASAATGALTFSGAAEVSGGRFNVTGTTLNDSITGGSSADTIKGGEGADTINGGGGQDYIDLTETVASADVVQFTTVAGLGDYIVGFAGGTGADVIQLSAGAAGLNIGNGDTTAAGEAAFATGTFAETVELAYITTAVAGTITAASAATAIGSATGAYGMGDVRIFVVNNGTDSAIYRFVSAAADSTVLATELTLVANVVGTILTTGTGDVAFIA